MRIDPAIKLPGRFWLPSTPDKSLSGTLTIKDGGLIRLEVLGRLDGGNPFQPPSSFARVIGEVTEHGLVTLEDCFLSSAPFNTSGIPAENKLHPRTAIFGVAYDVGEKILFDELKFSIEGLDEWLAITGFTTSLAKGPERKYSIEYTPPGKRELWHDDRFSLGCEFEWSVPNAPLKSAKITQTAYLRLRSVAPTALEDFLTIVHRLAHLVAFGLDENVSIQSVTAYAATIRKYAGSRLERPLPLPLYFEALSFSEKPPKLKLINRLFTLGQLPISSQAAFDAWFKLHETSSTAMNLYFSTRKTRFDYLNIQFLLLAQAVEVYHRDSSTEKLIPYNVYRKLKEQIVDSLPDEHRSMISEKLARGNDLTLYHRLDRLTALFENFFGDAPIRAMTNRAIVATRNYYTHWGKTADREEIGGRNLWINLKRLDMLMQMNLLKELGYSLAEVERLLEANLEFQRHQHLLKRPIVQHAPAAPLASGSPQTSS